MTDILLNQSFLITFVLVDTNGVEVPGLGTAWAVEVSKNGGAFAAGTGTKAEISDGWYSYTVPVAETNTAGPLAVKITHASTAQQNLLYQVVGATWGSSPAILSLAELKAYLNITTSDEDTLLTAMLARAEKAISSYTDRLFVCSADTTKYFTVGQDTSGAKLYLDEDLAAITSIVTNADDGAGGTPLTGSDYITHPRNKTPYWCIEILGSSSAIWDYTADPENGVTVTGRWAYSVTPPDDIVQACLRLAAYYYRGKDSQVFDITAMPEMGTLVIPKGIPADVKVLLDPYVRPRL